jgi:hypothetical protein
MTLTIPGVLLGIFAAVCFYSAALAPLGNRQRALVGVLGILSDWLPVLLGWMSVHGSPSPVLYASHLGFGVAGYALLLYCLAGWIRNRNPPLGIRVSFLAVWTVAFLAGFGMAAASVL